ncbi:MAG: hypothetical protein JWP85_2093 [Rhodoglobus sp.]|nr:hypothetical protein [Rhodoglobus sp.]
MSASHHVEQAIDLLKSIELSTIEVHGQSGDARYLRLQLAGIHATLALAEQQSIANLIAVATHDEDRIQGELRGEIVQTIRGDHPNADGILIRHAKIGESFRRIREGLGL